MGPWAGSLFIPIVCRDVTVKVGPIYRLSLDMGRRKGRERRVGRREGKEREHGGEGKARGEAGLACTQACWPTGSFQGSQPTCGRASWVHGTVLSSHVADLTKFPHPPQGGCHQCHTHVTGEAPEVPRADMKQAEEPD